MGMYQTIDDDPDAIGAMEDSNREDGAAPAGGRGLRWLVIALAATLVALLMYIVLSAPVKVDDPSPQRVEDARASYLAALSEPSPALRRARLADYLAVHPDSDRAEAVRAQMGVLDAREASDWAGVTDALYDRSLRDLDRLAVLDAYEAKWGPNLLGGRSDEIAALRESWSAVEDDPDPAPLRALEEGQSPIPNSIQANSMAGGPVTAAPLPRIVAPPRPAPLPATPRRETPPRVVRSEPPRYPRSAQRRGIAAVVELEMDVDARGRVDDVRILSVDADRYGKEFARAARRAARRMRFEPRLIDGQPVAAGGVRKRYRFEP